MNKLILLLVLLAVKVHAESECGQANSQFLSGDRTKAAAMFSVLAREGYVCGYEGLGEAFMQGIGIEKDLKKSLLVWQKAKEKGSAIAEMKINFLVNAINKN